MLNDHQMSSLSPKVRALVLRLAAENAWQQISDLLQETPEKQMTIATVAASNSDKRGRYFGEISVAKSQ